MGILRDNAELLQAFRRGDRAALDAVYCEYAEQLLVMLKEGFAIESLGKRYLFEGYREPWHLESAAQEIFTRAFSQKARTAYDGLRPYKNYLFTIARNYVVDLFRKKQKRFIPLEEIPEPKREDIELTEKGHADPEGLAVSHEMEVLVQQFVTALDAFEKELFGLRFTSGMSVEACAKKAGVTEYRVKRTEKKIKLRFYRYMKKRGYFDGFRYGGAALSIFLLLSSAALGGTGVWGGAA
jgi:RNA polymerase sigma-70 factor (ECF subfamily)